MDTEDTLSAVPLLPGEPALQLYAVGRGDRNEILAAIESLKRTKASEAADLQQRFLVIAVNYPQVPSSYLKPMAGYPDIWEIRFRDHRFFGFMIEGRRLYLCRYDYKNQRKADQEKLRSTQRLLKEWREP